MKRTKNVRKSMLLFTGGLITGAVGGIFACTKLVSKDQAVEIVSAKLTNWIDNQIFADIKPRKESISFMPGTYHYENHGVPNPRYRGRYVSASRENKKSETIVVATRLEAQDVLDRLFNIVSNYGSATVSDLYTLVGLKGTFNDEKYGWTDIRGSGVTKTRGGYSIDLPEPKLLEDAS